MWRYNCNITRELWEERYERELAKKQAEFDEAVAHPFRYVWNDIPRSVPGMYRRCWQVFTGGFRDLLSWDFNGIKDIFRGFAASIAIPFITIFALVFAPKVVPEFLEPHLDKFKAIKYPKAFEGVWEN